MVEEKPIIAISFCIFKYTTEIKQKSIKPDTEVNSVDKFKDNIILVKQQFKNINNFLNEVTNNINDSNIIEIDLGQNSYDIINKNASNKYDTIFMYEIVYTQINTEIINLIKNKIKNYDFYSVHKINSNQNEISNGDITLYDKTDKIIDIKYNIAEGKKINNSINEICNIPLLINNINFYIDFYNKNYLNNNKINKINNISFFDKEQYNEKILELPKEIFNNYILQKYVNIPIIKKIHAAYIPLNEHGIGKFEKINEFIPSNIKYDSTQISEKITLKDIQLILLDFDKVNNLITEGETKLIKIDQNEIDSAYEYFQQLETKINKSIITYVKINNTTPKIFNNKRFEIKIHENNKKMLVRYNEDEENYYSKENEISDYKLKSTGTNKYIKPKIKKYDYKIDYKSDDDKSVKETSTNSVIDDDRQYLLGNFTHIFKPNEKNKDMVDKMEHILKLIEKDNPPPIFIIGYGSSGAGKTSNLIYYRSTDEKNNEDGILPFLCKKIIQNEIKTEENKIEIVLKTQELYKNDNTKFDSNTYYFDYDKETNEIFLNDDTRNDINIKIKHSYRFNFNQNDELLKDSIFEADPKNMDSNPLESSKKSKEDKTKQNKTQDINKKIKENIKLGELIQFLVDVDRIVKSTTNNPQSSRSHVLVFVDMIINGKIINLIVGDFAGIENEFICNDNTLNEMSEQKNTLSKNVNERGEKETFYMHQPILNKDFKHFDTYRGGEIIEDIAFKNDKTNIDEKIIEIKETFESNKNYNYFQKIQESILNVIQVEKINKNINNYTQNVIDLILNEYKNEYIKKLNGSNELKNLIETKNILEQNLPAISTENIIGEYINDPIFYDTFKNASLTSIKSLTDKFLIHDGSIRVKIYNPEGIIATIAVLKDRCDNIKLYRDHISNINNMTDLNTLNKLNLPGVEKTGIPYKKEIEKSHIIYFSNNYIDQHTTKDINLYLYVNFDNTYVGGRKHYAVSNVYSNVNFDAEIQKFNTDIKNLIQTRITYFTNIDANKKKYKTDTEKINALDIQINEFVDKKLEDKTIDQGHIYKYFVNNQDDLFNYFYLTILKKYMLYTACKNRREEGTWINSSLENIRKAIQYIVQSKDFNIFYNYIDSCLSNTDQHYSPENLGLLIKQEELKKELENNIFIDLIHKNLSIYRKEEGNPYSILQMAKDMVICVYCVFNFSPKINDPPKSPYYNINFLNEIRNINDLKDIITNKEKKLTFLNKITRLMHRTNNNDNLFDNNTIDIFKKANVFPINDEEREAFGQIFSGEEDVLLNELINIIINKIGKMDDISEDNNLNDIILTGIRMICRVINIINATSSMGSLEFIDQIAKLNTTQYLCEYNESNDDNESFNDVTIPPKKK